MNREQFIEALEALTEGLRDAERAQLIAYYTEMIDDRVEAGMTEEQAVAALGAPEALVQEFLPQQGDADGQEIDAPDAAPQRESADPSAQFVDALREVHIHMKTGDAVVRREALPNGAAAQLQFSDPLDFSWRIEDGALVVTENPRQRKKHGLFGLEINFNGIGVGLGGFESPRFTLILSDVVLDRLIFDSHGGDARFSDVRVGELMALSSSSGDIELERAACDGRVEINDRSGDVTVRDCAAARDFKAEAISGDVKLRDVRAGSLRARAVSGDIGIAHASADTLNVNTVSGDVELREADIAAQLLCETTSGDLDIDRPACPELRLLSVSGDIDVALPDRAGGYVLNANSRSGDISLPKQWQTPAPSAAVQATVDARTASGDIDIRVLP